MSRPRGRVTRVMRRRERDERGATAVFVALVLGTVLMLIAAFAIDLGMQRAGRRDMQAVADLVALDMGRLIDGRTRSEIEAGSAGKPSAATQLGWSVANNDDTAIGDGLSVTAYWVELETDGSYAQAGGVPVEVGPGQVPTGVVVRAAADVGFLFAGFTGVASGDVERRAVALAEESACFRLGSYAARLDTKSSALLDAILGDVLGGGVNLDVLSYTGIANADISLLDIALEMGLGSVDELLGANVNAGSLLIAAANVLQADGTSHADILNMVGVALGGLSINIGDLIDAEPGTSAAETVTVNALDLLASTVLIANGTNAIAVPNLDLNLPFLGTDAHGELTIIEKPRTKCGKRQSQVDTSQVALSLAGTLVSLPTVLGLSPTNVSTEIAVNVASARGTLTDIICGSETAADPSGMDVQVTSGVAGASATISLNFNGAATGSGPINGLLSGITRLLQMILAPIIRIEVSGSIVLRVQTADPTKTRTAEIRVPNNPPDWDVPVSTGSGDLGLKNATVEILSDNLTISAKSGGLLGGLVNVNLQPGEILAIINNLVAGLASSLVNPLVTALEDNLLDPLYDLLGLSLGGADVFGQRPSCSEPTLVG